MLTTALQLFSKAPSFLGLAHPASVSTGQVEQWVCVNVEFMAQIPPPPKKKSKPYKYLIIFAARGKNYFNIPSSIF